MSAIASLKTATTSATLLLFSYIRETYDVCRGFGERKETRRGLLVQNRAGELCLVVKTRFGNDFLFLAATRGPDGKIQCENLPDNELLLANHKELTTLEIPEELAERIVKVSRLIPEIAAAKEALLNLPLADFAPYEESNASA